MFCIIRSMQFIKENSWLSHKNTLLLLQQFIAYLNPINVICGYRVLSSHCYCIRLILSFVSTQKNENWFKTKTKKKNNHIIIIMSISIVSVVLFWYAIRPIHHNQFTHTTDTILNDIKQQQKDSCTDEFIASKNSNSQCIYIYI